jgi:tetratricopeptide (TPR) repeat protein
MRPKHLICCVIFSMSPFALPQSRPPRPHISRPAPNQLKMQLQPNGEATGSTSIETIGAYPATMIAIPVEAGTLRLELTWKGDNPLMMSVTAPAGHNLPGRIAIAFRTGPSPLRFEYRISSAEAEMGPLQVELMTAMSSRVQRVRALTLEEGKLTATIVPAARVTSAASDLLESELNDGDLRQIMAEGRLLSKNEADLLESKLPTHPDDLRTRLSLLAFYSSRARQLPNTREVVLQRRRQMLWTIEHQGSSQQIFLFPEAVPARDGDMLFDPEGTAQATQLWTKLTETNPNDIPLRKNAARFLMHSDFQSAKGMLIEGRRIRPADDEWVGLLAELYATAIQGEGGAPNQQPSAIAKQAESDLRASEDPNLLATVAITLATPEKVLLVDQTLKLKLPAKIDLAEELANRAMSLQPNQPIWAAALINVLQTERATTRDPKQRLSATKKMYEQLKGIVDPRPNQNYPAGNYSTLAALAYDLDDVAGAERYSQQAIALAASRDSEDDSSITEAQHDASSTLGRLALRKKDIETAKKFLAQAAAASSTGTFGSEGPDMSLAQGLLALSERKAVLEYLTACKDLWPTGAPLLQTWSDEIQQGKTPHLNEAR